MWSVGFREAPTTPLPVASVFLREAVGEAEGDGLEELFGVAVGEIASGIPLFGSANVPVGIDDPTPAEADLSVPIFEKMILFVGGVLETL